MKNKVKQLLNRIAVAILVAADAAVTRTLEKFIPTGEPTLKSIISTFDVAAAQLATFEKRQLQAAEQHDAELRRLEVARREVLEAASRASRIQTRLTNLVS